MCALSPQYIHSAGIIHRVRELFRHNCGGGGSLGGLLFISPHSFRFPHREKNTILLKKKKKKSKRLGWKQSELVVFILFLFIPQDLKPGNLAINPDCELKVR